VLLALRILGFLTEQSKIYSDLKNLTDTAVLQAKGGIEAQFCKFCSSPQDPYQIAAISKELDGFIRFIVRTS
jgi:hypothetical protein